MALFAQYTPPGVYTFETVSNPGVITYGNIRLPVFIGEGQETFSVVNKELHRGSSASADDLIVNEVLPVLTIGQQSFQLTYTPVCTGAGTGTLTNDPTQITVTLSDGQTPVVVTSLNGSTGVFTIFNIYPEGTQLEASYYFKRKDTYVTENEAFQVPSFALWSADASFPLTLSLPGELGNDVDLGFTFTPGAGVSDALAISGVGTDAVSIELNASQLFSATAVALTFTTSAVTRATGSFAVDGVTAGMGVTFAATTANNTTTGDYFVVSNITTTTNPGDTLHFVGTPGFAAEVDATATYAAYVVRTYGNLSNLLTVGIPTPAGNLALQSVLSSGVLGTTVVAAVASAPFAGGAGPNSNTTFATKQIPVVDGSNGGVVTTNPALMTALVNGIAAPVLSLNGATGIFTMANPVLSGSTFEVSYYTNHYQDTYDMLPSSNVASIDAVGYGPDRNDFVQGVDFVLQTPANEDARIQWGGSASIATGSTTPGFTPFNASVITDTLVDEIMFLRPATGAVTGKNFTFILPDVPTDGSGLGVVTNNPSLVHMYVGDNPEDAFHAGEVVVTQVIGAIATVVLYNPPSIGSMVFATYYRNTLNAHAFTLKVVNPGVTGQGTYTIADESNNALPTIAPGTYSVAESGPFVETGGIIWPNKFSDLNAVGGDLDETITLTFQPGDAEIIVTPAAQATITSITNAGLLFTSTNTGTGPNGVASIAFIGVTEKDDNVALSKAGQAISVYITKTGGTTRDLQDIIDLFASQTPVGGWPTSTGVIICSSLGTVALTTTADSGTAENFADGAAAITTPRSIHFCVTSSAGLTGGAVTDPSHPAIGAVCYLNQTYVDSNTGVKFTILDSTNSDIVNDHLYGIQSLPTPGYNYQIGDKLSFVVSKETPFTTSTRPIINIYGLTARVVSTYGMSTGNTAILTTFKGSGKTPAVGDFYYVSLTTEKTAADFGIKIFDNPSAAYAQYGQVTPLNKLSMAASLFTQNGGNLFACLQVPKQTGLNTAADQTFINAISSLAAPLPGTEQKAGMIQVMSTSQTVIQSLGRFLLTQASPRNNGEAVSVYGYGFNDTPASMQALSTGLKNERMIGIASIGAILQLVDPTTGIANNYTVDGSVLAAAMAGMMVSPASDVATTLTRQSMVGFQGLITRYDDPTMDMLTSSGLTCVVENAGALVIRHWVTTDNSNPLKREPTSRLVVDYVRQTMRSSLNQFIGRKLIQSTVNTVTSVVATTLAALVAQEIIEGYSTISVMVDSADPTILNVSFMVKPIFSLLWISVTLTVTTQL
jgi:hypothetical protein